MRPPKIEKAPADTNRAEAQVQNTTRRDDTPLRPALVKLIHLLADALVREQLRKSGGP
jgi:hypothetical protein